MGKLLQPWLSVGISAAIGAQVLIIVAANHKNMGILTCVAAITTEQDQDKRCPTISLEPGVYMPGNKE